MLRLLTPCFGHSILRIAATSGILAGAFTLFRLGYLILTVDAIIKLFLTFIYTHVNSQAKGDRGKTNESLSHRNTLPQLTSQEPAILEELKASLVGVDDLSLGDKEPGVVGCVVGWREDEELYARCLESIISTPSCTAIVAGIDGDEVEDERMVEVFQKVSRQYSLVVPTQSVINPQCSQPGILCTYVGCLHVADGSYNH